MGPLGFIRSDVPQDARGRSTPSGLVGGPQKTSDERRAHLGRVRADLYWALDLAWRLEFSGVSPLVRTVLVVTVIAAAIAVLLVVLRPGT